MLSKNAIKYFKEVLMNIKKIKNNKKIIITVIIACILIPVIVFCSQIVYLLYFRSTPTIVNDSNTIVDNKQSGLPSPEESGIDNIVLFGVDNRTPTDHGRTDSIIIATIDKNMKVIKLTSIMRDLYVKIGDTKSLGRINGSYATGGPALALKTLNNNFGLNVKYYAVIDFNAFQDLVDELGGIDVEVKDYEVKEINYYIKSVNWSNPIFIKGAGFQHLNGQQTLSFARIRKVGNGDYERTERQRLVLKSLSEKSKQTNIVKFPQLLTTLVSYVQTNVPLSKIFSLGIIAYRFNNNIESIRIPVDGYYEGQNVGGASVLVPDISANALFLKDFIYNLGATTSSKPKPKIPNYRTPNIPLKDGEIPITPKVTPKVTPSITPGDKPGATPAGTSPTPTIKPVTP